jgi:hypothetical protein
VGIVIVHMRVGPLRRFVRRRGSLSVSWGPRVLHITCSSVTFTGPDFQSYKEALLPTTRNVSNLSNASGGSYPLRTAYSHLLSQSRLKEDPVKPLLSTTLSHLYLCGYHKGAQLVMCIAMLSPW